MQYIFSLSIILDEASDIQMHGNLNVLINVCLYTGEVRTLTLAIKGEGGSITIFVHVINILFAFKNFLIVSMNYSPRNRGRR
jgi:hypothetical protein